jgi:hypothetical protein
MDLSDPTRAVTPTLDGPVLAVLAAAGRPLTAGEVAAEAARGSEIGIRRSLARLVEQGIVRATIVGRNRVHELNRDHVAAGVAVALAGLRLELWRRLRAELAGWDPPPLYAAVFGSAARGDGDAASDIDLLLVRDPFPGELHRPERSPAWSGWAVAAEALVAASVAVKAEHVDPERWQAQVDRLRALVQRWTGNPLQVVELSIFEWSLPSDAHDRLLTEVRQDGVDLVRHPRLVAGSRG